MITFITIFSFILGAILGSFLLVVSLRFNTGKSLKGRSSCFSCNKSLNWYELIPLFSYLIQKGRCRGCKSFIQQETFLVEFCMGLVLTLINTRALFHGLDNSTILLSQGYLIGSVYLMIVFSVLAVVFLYDLRHKIIPDQFSLVFALLGLFGSFFI